MAEYQILSQGLDDGVKVAISGGKMSLYGNTTPVVQPATPAATVTAGSTTTVCNTAVAEIQAALIAIGAMAAS